MIKQKLDDDLKAALLAGDTLKTSVLRGLKSAILYAEVAAGSREIGLDDENILQLFGKEAKKRQESADLYIKGGDQVRAEKELQEKQIIEAYLPQQLTEAELTSIAQHIIEEQHMSGLQDMGKAIGLVKTQVGASAEGGVIARIVKELLSR